MISEANPEKKQHRPAKKNPKISNRSTDDSHQHRFAAMTRPQFANWLKLLSNEERYLTLKVSCPQLVNQFLALRCKSTDQWKLELDAQKPPTKSIKLLATLLQAFIDGLVLISDQDYLDSIGFDFSFVGCPEKLFDTLYSLTSVWAKVKETKLGQEVVKILTPQKSEWITQILTTIEKDYTNKSTLAWDSSILEREKTEKKDFGNFWKNLSKPQKINFLFFGYDDATTLIENIMDENCDLKPSQLDEEISELMSLDKKQICNKIFKCKLKKFSIGLCTYHELIYRNWRDFGMKKKTEGKHFKKIKPLNKRDKSIDEYSNETNETEKKQKIIEITHEELYSALDQDIIECTDVISDNSNKFFDRRVLGYERIEAIFRLYDISCRLFGSCASGITIKQSDIDIAINESILKMFQMEEDKKSQISKAFQFMGQIFESLPWVTNVKVIAKAAIPIIKLTINTQIPVTQQFFTQQYRSLLNRKIDNGGQIHADLTIQITQEETSSHLGVISTNQINKWLEEIPTLRQIIVLLKYQISKRSMNETYTGGLNTYCLVVIVVSFIYHFKLEGESNSALVLMKLLDFYGWRFDEKTCGIDLRDLNCIFYQKSQEETVKFADLEVKDPLNNGKNMTRNCYAFEKIKEIFRSLYTQCFLEKEKAMQSQYAQIRKRLSKLKKEESETESGSEKECVKNFFLDLLL